MSRDWRGFLDDMIESSERAVSFVRGLDFTSFVADAKTRSAVQRELFVIGEAAKQIPLEVRTCEPAIDWRGLAGLRDLLAHQYFRIDDAIVWDVVTSELPGLAVRVRALAARLP